MDEKFRKLNIWDNILNIIFIILLIAVVILYLKGYEVNPAYVILVFGLINIGRSSISKSYSDICKDLLNKE